MPEKIHHCQPHPLTDNKPGWPLFLGRLESMSMLSKICRALVAAVLCVSLAGCGGPSDNLQPIEGTVTFDGEPIEDGRIQFRGTTDPRAYSAPIENGKYEVRLPEGALKVQVTASRPVPGKFDESNPGERVPVGEMYIPAKYNSQSELTTEITSDSTVVDFDLTSAK